MSCDIVEVTERLENELCLLIVLGLGTVGPGNFTRNLRLASEQDFLLFI